MFKEQEFLRMDAERKKREEAANSVARLAGEESPLLAQLAAADPQAFVGEAIKSQFATVAPGESWRVLTPQEVEQAGLDPRSDWQMNTATKKIDKLYSPPTAPQTNVYLPPEQSSFLKGVGEKAAGQLDGLQTSADSAAKMLGSINKLKPLLSNPAFIAGTLGDARLVVAKALGLPGATDTQAYFAAVGEQVAERIKAFGAGTGLSDADREFAKQIAAGSIELTPAAIKKIIDINERSANELLDKYHERRKFYSQKNPEVVDYFPEITVPGATGVDALLDKYAPRGQ
jgi:hypothetical protein